MIEMAFTWIVRWASLSFSNNKILFVSLSSSELFKLFSNKLLEFRWCPLESNRWVFVSKLFSNKLVEFRWCPLQSKWSVFELIFESKKFSKQKVAGPWAPLILSLEDKTLCVRSSLPWPSAFDEYPLSVKNTWQVLFWLLQRFVVRVLVLDRVSEGKLRAFCKFLISIPMLLYEGQNGSCKSKSEKRSVPTSLLQCKTANFFYLRDKKTIMLSTSAEFCRSNFVNKI